jgi:2-methylisocitrate lyase-like PEP mutase family enzyme
MNHQQLFDKFSKLHVPGTPLILYNIWDVGSAIAVAAAGAKAIATSSYAVAHANGFDDGEHIPMSIVVENLRRIVQGVDLPVSVDLESGYGENPEDLGQTINMAIAAGAIGCNLEDSEPTSGAVRGLIEQTQRIKSARRAADIARLPFFLNARCDLFFQGTPEERILEEAIERAHAYADAGANGFFVPGLHKISVIAELVKQSPIPVNIMVDEPNPPIKALSESGVARVSYGASPYTQTVAQLEQAARNRII